jgi:aryl-alcohol dehydrogenase-like predicted oxidoreductase
MKFNFSNVFNRNISALGYGCWGIGGFSHGVPGYGHTDDVQSLMALHKALDLGVNYFDTANIYGDGRSEILLGRALSSSRSDVVIASKAGKLPHNKLNFSPKALMDSVNGSLKRLNTDYIDLLQLHDPDPYSVISDDIVDCLSKLKAAGKIKHTGASLKSPSDAKYFCQPPFEVLQVNLNLIDQRAIIEQVFSRAEKNSIEIITRTPLAFGFLTGHFIGVKNPNFPVEDHRSAWPKKQIEAWIESPQKFKSVLENTEFSITELALRFSISQQNTICVLSGMMTPKEVEENVQGVSNSKELSLDHLEEIYSAYQKNTFFVA